jgi:replicative DNA helicase
VTRRRANPAPMVPHDDDVEASVLGGIFLRNEVLQALGHLEVEDFFNPRHQAVFAAMRNLEHYGRAIDGVTVAAELRRMERLGMFGTEDLDAQVFCGELTLRVPSRENTEHYARILVEHRQSRDVMRACSAILEDLRTGQLAGEDAVHIAVSHLLSVRRRGGDHGRVLGELMLEELAAVDSDLEALQRGHEIVVGMPTGIPRLDDETGGYPIGVVSLVMGGTGHGKSTLMAMGARAAAWAGHVPFVYSYEDPNKFWAQRGLAQESGVPTERIASRHKLEGWRPQLARAANLARNRREVIIPAAGMTAADLIRDARRRRLVPLPPGAKSQGRLVVVDYLQVMKHEFSRGVDKRTEAIAATMDQLQWLAQGCGNPADACAVVIGAQVKQDVEDEKRAPRLNDCADSHAGPKVAKFVVGINRPSKYDPSANRLFGQIDVLKRNQGDDLITVEVVMDLATHTIRCTTQQPLDVQATLAV